MAPKRKPIDSPTGLRQLKKRCQMKDNSIPALKDDVDSDPTKTGKMIKNNNNTEDKGFVTFKGNHLAPKITDKVVIKKELEVPNLALNQLCMQKSKINLQG